MACKLNCMPSLVNVGFVMGAEIADAFVVLVRRPCDTVQTGIGDLLAGPSLSYGTERSVRSVEVWRARGFLRPKRVSMVHTQKRARRGEKENEDERGDYRYRSEGAKQEHLRSPSS